MSSSFLKASTLFLGVVFCCFSANAQQPLTPQQEAAWNAFRGQRQQLNQEVDQFDRMMNQAKSNPALFSLIGLAETNPELCDFLGLVDLQIEELNLLKEAFEEQIKIINSDEELSFQQRGNKIAAARHVVCEKVGEVLLPKQLKRLHRWDMDTDGLPKLLVNSEVGNALELTERQKEAIKTKSEKLAIRIKEMVEEFRQEAADIVVDELTEKQAEQLEKLFSKQRIQDYFEQMDIGMMYGHYLFEIPEEDRKKLPSMLLYESKLDLKEFSDEFPEKP